ncbi:MAG: arginine--tRNA ligase [Oscillospiraceae bacterium]
MNGSNFIKTATNEIYLLINTAFNKAITEGQLPQGEIPAFTVEIPGDTSHGDFATNAAMLSARSFRLAPAKIATILTQNMDMSNSVYIAKTEIAGPGFINFFIKDIWFSDASLAIIADGENYGRTDFGQGERVMVEFVSANPTGPMHMGNARGGAIGDGLAAALEWSGHEVCREFYINDAGNQINRFGLSLEVRYLQLHLGDDAVTMPEECYQGEDIKTHAIAFSEIYGDKFVNASHEERLNALVDFALPLNIAALKSDLGKYRINYDVWFSENSLHTNGDVDKTIALLKENGFTYEKDGAIWYNTSKMTQIQADKHGKKLTEKELAELKDDVLIRANGFPTYFAADIAYHYNKFAVRGYNRCINVWGADHHGHVARIKGAMDAVGLNGDKLDIVLMQLVRLLRDGQPCKMSKRSGKAITLTDLLEEIPIDAARFFFNMREPNSTLDFDLDLAVEQSKSNPVYYVQYAHARICSIKKNLAAEGIVMRTATPQEMALLNTNEERELIRLLAAFPNEIIAAACGYDPARLTRYAISVATLFHKFYDSCRIKGEENSLMQARLTLATATKITLANLLTLLKISAPEAM